MPRCWVCDTVFSDPDDAGRRCPNCDKPRFDTPKKAGHWARAESPLTQYTPGHHERMEHDVSGGADYARTREDQG